MAIDRLRTGMLKLTVSTKTKAASSLASPKEVIAYRGIADRDIVMLTNVLETKSEKQFYLSRANHGTSVNVYRAVVRITKPSYFYHNVPQQLVAKLGKQPE